MVYRNTLMHSPKSFMFSYFTWKFMINLVFFSCLITNDYNLSFFFLLWLSIYVAFTDFIFFFIYFYWLEANYFTTFQWVLSNIDMNQPCSYMYSPSRSPLPPPFPPDSSGSSKCTRPSTCLMHPTWAGDLFHYR